MSAYDDLILSLNPLVYIKGEEATGDYLDSSPNALHTEVVTATVDRLQPPLTNDGYSSYHDGSNAAYYRSTASSLLASPSGAPRSFVIWLKTTSTAAGRVFQVGGSSVLTVTVNTTSGKVTIVRLGATITSGVTVNDGTRHLLVITDPGSTSANQVKLYTDNAADGTGTRTSNTTTSAGFFVGASSTLGTDYEGHTAKFAIFDTVLTTDQIADIWEAGTSIGLTGESTTPAPEWTFVGTGALDVDVEDVDLAGAVTTPAPEWSITAAGAISGEEVDLEGAATYIGPNGFITMASGQLDTGVTLAGSAQVEAPTWTFRVGGSVGPPRPMQGGRRRIGTAYLLGDPPVEPPPETLPVVTRLEKAKAFSEMPTIVGGLPSITTVGVTRTANRHRITVAGVDITYLDGIPTPMPAHALVKPLTFGGGLLKLPQLYPAFEKIGVGRSAFLARPQAPVIVQEIDADGEVVRDIYRGVVMSWDTGDDYTVQCTLAGEVLGPASTYWRPYALFRNINDGGQRLWNAVSIALKGAIRVSPTLGPVTGIPTPQPSNMYLDEQIAMYDAMAIDAEGNKWTTEWRDSERDYLIRLEDRETIHYTVYPDQVDIIARLKRDFASEFTRVFAEATLPNGMRVDYSVHPGLIQGDPPPYPFADGRSFGPGIDDNSPDVLPYEDGVIKTMIMRLWRLGLVSREDIPGGYDDDVADGIRTLKRRAGLVINGNMSTAAWDVLWDVGGDTGYTYNGSKILPAAQHPQTEQFLRTGTGAEFATNPRWDPLYPIIDGVITPGATPNSIAQLTRWSEKELAPEYGTGNPNNWAGEIIIAGGMAVIRGEHNPGDPITVDDIMAPYEIRPEMNGWLPTFDGGIVMHTAGKSYTPPSGKEDLGSWALLVDTQARTAAKVWAVIERDKEARRNPSAEFFANYRRSSTMPKDSITPWTAWSGLLDGPIRVPAHTWVVRPVIAGQEGQVREVNARTNPRSEYVFAVFGRPIDAAWIEQRVPNPLADDSRWGDPQVFNRLRARVVHFVAGTVDDPCGYSPGRKTNKLGERSNAPLSGKYHNAQGFPYATYRAQPVFWVAIYADRATWFKGGEDPLDINDGGRLFVGQENVGT